MSIQIFSSPEAAPRLVSIPWQKAEVYAWELEVGRARRGLSPVISNSILPIIDKGGAPCHVFTEQVFHVPLVTSSGPRCVAIERRFNAEHTSTMKVKAKKKVGFMSGIPNPLHSSPRGVDRMGHETPIRDICSILLSRDADATCIGFLLN